MPTAKEQAALLAATANSDAISAQQDKAAAQAAAQRAAAAAAAQRAEFQYLAGIPAARRSVAQVRARPHAHVPTSHRGFGGYLKHQKGFAVSSIA